MKWPFSKNKETSNHAANNEFSKRDAINTTFFQQLNERRAIDPLVGAKLGSKEIFGRLTDAMKTEKGVHVESLLAILGSLAGYSCQTGVRREYIEKQGLAEEQVFITVECEDGSKYFFGDKLNKPLLEDQYSVWSLAAGMAQHLEAKEVVDLNELVKYVTGTIGSDLFGIPRIPEGHRPSDTPYNYCKYFWPAFLPIIEKFCYPLEWPILFAMAIQECMELGKNVIEPSLALSIVMECALPMSKVDLKQ